MKLPHKIIIYLIVLCYALAFCDAQIDFLPSSADIIDKAFIIQYEPTLSPRIILDRIRDAGINYTLRYNLEIIDSVSVKFNEFDDANKCSKISGIETVWPVTRLKPRLFTAHKITGLDVFREKTGYDGTGIKVGVVDTGLDYNHPAFGQCFKTPGCKTQFGFDFVGDGDVDFPNEDDDPIDECVGHGTHVTGIIAADDHELNFSGVSPGVTLGVYRVIDCGAFTSDDLIIAGLNAADKDGMDIINMSLGGNFRGWNDTPLGNAVNKLSKKGIVLVVSASEFGDNGLFASGDPDSAANVITVGHVDNLKFRAFVMTLSSDGEKEIPYISTRITERYLLPGPLPIAIANTTEDLPEFDGCNPYNVDLTGKIAVIRRGQCGFQQKVDNAFAAGAIGTIFYNNDTTLPPAVVLLEVSPTAMLDNVDGEYLKKEIRKYPDLTVTFPNKIISVNHINAGRPSNDSSWGPTFDLDIKPEILAPGGRIFSTFPLNLGKYATLSGSSMGSAYASGSIALYMQATGLKRGTIDPIGLRDLLTYSAKPFYDECDEKFPISPNKQGGGLINIIEALKTKVLIQPSKLLLNDSAHFDGTHTIKVKNTGKKTTKYTFNHIPAKTIRGFFADVWIDTRLFILEKRFAGVKFSKNSVIVRPGVTAKITVKFTQPNHLPNDFGVYSGYISIKDSANRKTSTIPYLGVKGDICDIPLLLNPFFIRFSNEEEIFDREDQIAKFTFKDLDFPQFQYFLNYGSRLVTMSLYKRGDFTPNGFVGLPILDEGFFNPENLAGRNGGTGTQFATIKPWSSRIVSDINGENNFEVPIGQYQMLLSVLKPFGNLKNKHDYVTWRSAIIEITDEPAAASASKTSTQNATPTQNT